MPFESIVALHVTDKAGYQGYREAMTPILTRMGGGFRYDFEIGETLKSASSHPITRLFAIYFPDAATKGRFFTDPGYLEAKKKFFEQSVAGITIIAEYDRP